MRCVRSEPFSIYSSTMVWYYFLLSPYPNHARNAMDKTITPIPMPNFTCFCTDLLLYQPGKTFDSITAGKRVSGHRGRFGTGEEVQGREPLKGWRQAPQAPSATAKLPGQDQLPPGRRASRCRARRDSPDRSP